MTWHPKSSQTEENFTLALKRPAFCASANFLQTQEEVFLNELQNLLLSEKTLEVLLLLRPGKMLLTFLLQQWFDISNASSFPEGICTCSLTPLVIHWSSLLLLHIFLLHFSLLLNLALICFDTALCKQPPFSAMTFFVAYSPCGGCHQCYLHNSQVSSLSHDCICVHWN